jgi:hypothetical protein
LAKKWYSYFVVADDQPEPSDAQPGRGSVQGGGAREAAPVDREPKRVTDVVPDAEADARFAAPITGPTDLGIVYTSAQIAAPAHGYTVLKVAEMLRSEHLQSLPQEVKRKSIMVALDAAGVKVAEIVEDAVRRDRALDTYERVLEKHLKDLRTQIETENAQIEAEIQQRVSELRARVDENTRKIDGEQAELLAWRTRKHQEEDTIADAVSYFVTENPISTARAGAESAKGDADVR